MNAIRLILRGLLQGLLLAGCRPAIAASEDTQPVQGIRANTPAVHALVGARIVVSGAQTIERGTIVVRDGLIAAVGPEVKAPADARVWQLDGKTVYPGLIDAYSPVSGTTESGGTPYWNSRVRPQRDGSAWFKLDTALNAALRSQGVTCRLIVPASGIVKGTSALVTTGDEPGKRAVLAQRVALHLRLSPGRGGEESSSYPGSPMGAVALARQVMCDADWYGRAWAAYHADPTVPRPERNDALECLQDYSGTDRLVIVDAPDEQYFLRADGFAREFALRIAVRGSGREYRRLEAIRATGRPVIVPLDFPRAPDVSTPEAVQNVSLGRLMDWDIAPENPGRLAKAGVKIALTGDGLRSQKDFLAAVRRAVQRGLDAGAALAALTTAPAELLGVNNRLGTIEAGKMAHLVVTDGELFADKTRVLETWVDGRRYELVPTPPVDLKGAWRVAAQDGNLKPLVVTIAKGTGRIEGTIRMDEKGAKETKLTTAAIRDLRLACSFDGSILGKKGTVQLSAVIAAPPGKAASWAGTIRLPEGTLIAIAAARHLAAASGKEPAKTSDTKLAAQSTEEKKPESPPRRAEQAASYSVNYPLGEQGRTAPPEQPAMVVFKNATVWTCENQGVLQRGTVIVGKGRIIAVGKDLQVPAGAVVIDAAGKHITPGVIDCHSHMATDGGVNESTQAVSSEVRIEDFVDATDVDIYRTLAGGVTVSHVLHGSSNPIGGQNQVIKLRWGALPEELKFIEAPATLKLALGENVKQANSSNPSSRYPQTRMGVVEIIRDAFEAAVEYRRRWQAWERTHQGLPPRRDLELEPLVEVIEHRRWVHCHAYRQDEILAVLQTLAEFGIDGVCLQHVLEGYKVADAMVRYRSSGSAFSDWWAYKVEAYDAIPYNGALMHRAGVLVSFNSDSAELARHLNHEAAKAMKYGGLGAEEALKLVTLYPARQLRVERYIGSLKPGKHADLTVWSGTPLSNLSLCEQTWIDGRKYFDRADDLRQRQEESKRHAALVQKALASGQTGSESGQPKPEPSELWPRRDDFED